MIGSTLVVLGYAIMIAACVAYARVFYPPWVMWLRFSVSFIGFGIVIIGFYIIRSGGS